MKGTLVFCQTLKNVIFLLVFNIWLVLEVSQVVLGYMFVFYEQY